jgi:uncharacterized protein YPO0396
MVTTPQRAVHLRQVRVINWHSILDRTITIPNSGLLIFGTNGSGKTTLQDAIQFGLFPNAATARFNSAVASSSRDRSVLGYVLQQVQEDAAEEGSGKRKGRPRYKHAQRTSYIALRFERGSQTKTFLVGMYGNADGTLQRFHASIEGVLDLQQLPLLDKNRVPTPIDETQRAVARAPKGYVHHTIDEYIGDVSDYLGSPHKDWPHLLKSAIAFAEITDATAFVRRFLSERPIDHGTLRQTYKAYEDLRGVADRTVEWVNLLSKAVGPETDENGRLIPVEKRPLLHAWRHFRALTSMHDVALARVPVRIAELDRRQLQETLDRGIAQTDQLERDLAATRQEREDQRDRVRDAQQQLADQGVLSVISHLESKVEQAKAHLGQSDQAREAVRRYISETSKLVEIAGTRSVQDLAKHEASALHGVQLLSEDGLARLNDFTADPNAVDLRHVRSFTTLTGEARTAFVLEFARLGREKDALRLEQGRLESEERTLRQGRLNYPEGVEAARTLLREKLGWADARPLCEMIEISEDGEEWRHAVEYTLARSRHDFLVPEHLFDDASKLHSQYSRGGYRTDAGGKEVFRNIAFVDIGKLRRDRKHRAQEGSLAEVVLADTPEAEDYIAYTLGKVQRERVVARLRSHFHAITPALDVYRAYKRYSEDVTQVRLYIGAHARAVRLEQIEQRLAAIRQEIRQLNDVSERVRQGQHILDAALAGLAMFRQNVEVAREFDARSLRLQTLRGDLERERAKPENRALIAEFEAARAAEVAAEEKVAALTRNLGEAQGQCKELSSQIRGATERLNKAVDAQDSALFAMPDGDLETGEARFREMLLARAGEAGKPSQKELEAILSTAKNQASENRRIAAGIRDDFVDVVVQFRQESGFLPKATPREPEPLVAEYERLIGTALPEAREKLHSKEREMRTGVVQAVLNTLGDSFLGVRRLVDEISRSTTKVTTRLGRFKLVARPTPEWKEIYDLAVESMSIPSVEMIEQADAEHPFLQKIENFMQLMLHKDTDLDALCDYRRYFDFEVHNTPNAPSAPGEAEVWTPFRGTRQGASGGERQIPFYVMTFALMDHIYRSGASASRGAGRLLLLDEVFHNMSDDNVADVMDLASKLGLQLIMVTPGKLRTLAPRFGKTLQVAKTVIEPGAPSRFIEYTQATLPEDLLDHEEYPSAEGSIVAALA